MKHSTRAAAHLGELIQNKKGDNVIDIYRDHLPWINTKEWNPDFWYPLGVGLMCRDTKEWRLESYGIFKLEPEGFEGDIIPVVADGLSLSKALEICEDFNKMEFVL